MLGFAWWFTTDNWTARTCYFMVPGPSSLAPDDSHLAFYLVLLDDVCQYWYKYQDSWRDPLMLLKYAINDKDGTANAPISSRDGLPELSFIRIRM